MNYKEKLSFVGKCLTISHNEGNLEFVCKEIQKEEFDWDPIVQVATSHYVFPALYYNLLRIGLISYLPAELVNYMKHLADLNRDRNHKIIEQATRINDSFRENGITPIFLKGTSSILQGLYDDIGERMIGDIDFLVSEEEFYPAAKILYEMGYERVKKELLSPVITKHYPRMFHKDEIAAVELHIDVLKEKLSKKFNYRTLQSEFISKDNFSFLGKEDQLALTILSKQYNDDGRYYKTVSLRNSYDVFLLCWNVDSLGLKNKYSFYNNLLNPYLALSSHFFSSKKIRYESDARSHRFIRTCLLKIKYPMYGKLHTFCYQMMIYLKLKFLGLIRFVSNKQFRAYYLKKKLNF